MIKNNENRKIEKNNKNLNIFYSDLDDYHDCGDYSFDDDEDDNERLSTKILSYSLYIFLIFSILATLVSMILRFNGYELCFIPTGSMEPTIKTGSLAIIDKKVSYENLEIGNIVVFYNENDDINIIHRIIDGDQYSGFRTKGDNNDTDDGITVTNKTYIGKEIIHISYLGYIFLFFTKYRILLILILALIFFEPYIYEFYKNKCQNNRK